jgi:integrase
LTAQIRLEIQYVLQRRADERRTRTTLRSIRPVPRYLAEQKTESLLDHSAEFWIARVRAQGGSTTATRALLGSEAYLARLTDLRMRLLVEILIRTGLRIGDATRLRVDCLVRDPQGAPYLHYRNHKMRRDAMVPIDEHLAGGFRLATLGRGGRT